MNDNLRYQLAEGVAIRTERFGGLVYSYNSRQLYFLHSHDLTEFVRGLTGGQRLSEALEAYRESHDLSARGGDILLKSIVSLERMGLIVSVPE